MDLGGAGDRTVWVRRLVEVNREFMKRAATMVLMREKWHGQLAASLEIRHATLPVTQDQHFVEATKQAFKLDPRLRWRSRAKEGCATRIRSLRLRGERRGILRAAGRRCLPRPAGLRR